MLRKNIKKYPRKKILWIGGKYYMYVIIIYVYFLFFYI